MEKQKLLVFELVCCGMQLECSVSDSLTLREVMEGLCELTEDPVRMYFDLSQPVILCDSRTRRALDDKKTAAQLKLPDGCKILVY